MFSSRSSQCVFCTFRQTFKHATPRRKFHAASAQLQPRRRQQPTAEPTDANKKHVVPYTEEERDLLRQRYSEAQIAALEAGESAVSIDDLINQAASRSDPWALKYFDDLSAIDAVADEPKRAPHTNFDSDLRLKTEQELDYDVSNLIENLPERHSWDDYKKLEKGVRLTVGKEEAEKDARSVLAPELFEADEMFDAEGEVVKRPKQTAAKKTEEEQADQEQITPALLRLMQMTGYSQQQISRFRVKTIIGHNVTNQTRLGKVRKMYFLTVAGNGNGLIGIGEGKAEEPDEARLQSQYRAIRNMKPILRYEKRTIFGDVKGKVGATELEIFNRPPGFGLRCSQYIWEIARCAGLSDLAARVTRARNPMNTVKAAVQALLSQRDPEEVARARGKKMVDVRKVYYAGNLTS